MQIDSPISTILHQKGTDVWSIPPDAVVFDAIKMMAERNIGALPVMDGSKLVGMFSERDYTRRIALLGKSSKKTLVSEIMSDQLIVASPDDSVRDCMRKMTAKRVRHLPVVDKDRMVGLISIGDLVNWMLSSQTAAIEQLEKYVFGEYPA